MGALLRDSSQDADCYPSASLWTSLSLVTDILQRGLHEEGMTLRLRGGLGKALLALLLGLSAQGIPLGLKSSFTYFCAVNKLM